MGSTVSLAPEAIAHIGTFAITNSLFTTWIVMILLLIVSILATRKMSLIPSGLQNFMELIIEIGYNFIENMAQSRVKVFLPIVMTFFLFIVVGNYLGMFPGFGTIGLNTIENGKHIFVPLLRGMNTDLNTTLAFAIISILITHALSIRYLGIKDYLKRWFSLNPIWLFAGLLEIISEFAKFASFSFRLFGNIYAGDVVINTISGFFALLLPLPFYAQEMIVAIVQAAVFAMLSLVFMTILTDKHTAEA